MYSLFRLVLVSAVWPKTLSELGLLDSQRVHSAQRSRARGLRPSLLRVESWQNSAVKVRLEHQNGEVSVITGLRAGYADALLTALDQVPADGDGGRLLFDQPRVAGAVRGAARVAFGAVWTVGALLAIASMFVGWSALVLLAALVIVGGGFVAMVWWRDVGVTVYADGTIQRAGWGGRATWSASELKRIEAGGESVTLGV